MVNNEGNAEIMGVVLLIAIFVAAITLMGVTMLSAPQPEKVPAVALDFFPNNDNTSVSLIHRGGETLNLNGTVLKVTYSNGTTSDNPSVIIDGGTPDSWAHISTSSSSSSTYRIGDVINLTAPTGSIDQVQLIWPGTGGAVLLGAWFPNSSSGRSPPAAVTGAVPITFPYPSEGPTRAQPTQTPPVPWVYFIANNTTTNGLPISFTNLTENQEIYGLLWNFGEGPDVRCQTKSITHLYPPPLTSGSFIQNYTVTLTLTDSNGPTRYNLSRLDYISVYQSPVAGFTASPLEGNSGMNVSFMDTTTGYITSQAWNFDDGTPTKNTNTWHIFNSSPSILRDYMVSLTAHVDLRETHESNTVTQFIKVHPQLVAEFIANQTKGSAPLNVSFNANTSKGDYLNYTWDFGDNSSLVSGQNPIHTYATAGNYTVNLTVNNTLPDPNTSSRTMNITVTSAPLSPPVANFTATPMNGTAPLNVTFKDISTNIPTIWNWSFGDGTYSPMQNPPVHTYTTFGSYNVTLTAGNAAGNNTSAPQTILVYSNQDTVRVDTGGTSNQPDCLGNVWQADQPYPPEGWGWGYTAASSGPIYQTGASINNTSDKFLYQTIRYHSGAVEYLFNMPNGTYNVQMKFAEIDAANVSTTNPRVFNVMVNGKTDPLNFNVYDRVGLNSATDLYSNVTVTNNNPIDIVLSGTTGQPMISAISIAPDSTWLSPDFTANRTAVNAQLPVQFTDTSKGDVTKRFWDFGDGETSHEQNPMHIYQTAGIYKVMLTAGNDNQSRTIVKQDNITVYQAPVAAFSPNRTEGNSGITVPFNASISTGYITNYSWNFGDGTTATGQNPTHIFYNYNTTPVTYTVTLNASNPWGSSTTTHTVIVHQPLAPSFYANQTIGNVPFPVQFTDTSTGDNISGRNWYFGDGGTSNVQNPVYQYQIPGTYPVSLSITNTWGINTTQRLGYITVRPQLAANFTASPTIGNSPLTVQFDASNSTGVITAYTWNFGDGTNTIGTSPIQTHTYYNNGTTSVNYIVSLKVGNQLAGTNQSPAITKTITVYPQLRANFTASPSEGDAPLNVTFVDRSTGENGNVTRTWTFGDGTTSSGQTPYHIYQTEGVYMVNLTIDNGFGSTSSTNGTVIVHIPLNASFTATPSSGNLPLPVQFNDKSTGYNITSWSWNFGDSAVSPVRNATHTYQSTGTFTVTLSISNQWETRTTTRTVTVISPLHASFSAATSGGGGLDAPRKVQFNDTSIGSPTNWSWSFGDGGTSTDRNPVHTYNTAGTYTVTLTISNLNGSDSTSDTISVITTKNHTISGIVFNDLNKKNTLPDSNEPGLAGWTVNLYQDYYGTITLVGTTTTGADGSYMFSGLDKNKNYVVSIDLPAGWQYTTPATGSYNQQMSGNQDFPDVDFGVFQAPLNGNVILNAHKPQSLMSGGYLQFTSMGSDSNIGVTIGGTFVRVNSGEVVKIVVSSNGAGNIQISGGKINSMQLQNATLYINNNTTPAWTGQLTVADFHGGNSNLTSTLTINVPSYSVWTSFTVNNVQIIPGQNDSKIINLYNVSTSSGGELNLVVSVDNVGNNYLVGSIGSCQIIA